MDKLLTLKDKIHEHSESVGLLLELFLLILALFVATKGSLKKALKGKDKFAIKKMKAKQKGILKVEKTHAKTALKQAKLSDKDLLKKYKAELKKAVSV